MTNMPSEYHSLKEWLLIGPMGPQLPTSLQHYPIICVDGGSQFTETSQIWIGDGDSGNIPTNHPATFIYPRDKDHSDLALALNLLKSSETSIVHMWGFFGGRTDHFLSNLGETHQFLSNRKETKLTFYDDKGDKKIIGFSAGKWTIHLESTFSLLAIEQADISLTGSCSYEVPLARQLTPLSSLGLSNKGFGEVTLKCSSPLFVVLESNS